MRDVKIQENERDVAEFFCEFLFEEQLLCNGCELNKNHCEGSRCGDQLDDFLNFTPKNKVAKLAFRAFGDKYYNLSMRLKNYIKNGQNI